MRTALQILLPLLVLAGAAFLVKWMLGSVQTPVVTAPPSSTPSVRTLVVQPQSLTLDVQSQGTVEPQKEIALSAQVAGRVVAAAKALRAGGFFAAGEVLLTIDDADYQLQVVQRRADVARAELTLARERAEAQAAVRAWQQLEGQRQPDALSTRELFVAEAEQALAAARAALQRSELDVARTKLQAPFAGRVRRANVEIGQIVSVGAPLATVYATDFAEVRLPIPDTEAAFVDLPLAAADADTKTPAPVELVAEFGGRRHVWTGVVDRTEGEIDRRTRQVTIVARVAEPYAASSDGSRPPLAVGMFVAATIRGRTFDDVVELPRAALRPDGTVLVVSPEHQLFARAVQVLRQDRRHVLVRSGLQAGERVCTSRLDAFAEGMRVHMLDVDAPSAAALPAEPAAATVPPGNGGK